MQYSWELNMRYMKGFRAELREGRIPSTVMVSCDKLSYVYLKSSTHDCSHHRPHHVFFIQSNDDLKCHIWHVGDKKCESICQAQIKHLWKIFEDESKYKTLLNLSSNCITLTLALGMRPLWDALAAVDWLRPSTASSGICSSWSWPAPLPLPLLPLVLLLLTLIRVVLASVWPSWQNRNHDINCQVQQDFLP